ncbi:hypothetical protein C8A03DRAFT_31258 [Achaetomium macrosporum]|uniref:C2H2-type domain-containing protein n=1 Tax=Achaetomium macrosporum TaxID=79813 RepID=A0AAN7CES3_9PEZI|nr:hypothetical protein C8A03DRAFT_31258 [Achaetomium macrosporum]
MTSERGSTATEAPRAPSASTLPQMAPATFGPVTDLTRQKSLKRTRETTPTSQDSLVSGGDISPSKIARLVGFARQSHPSSAGEAVEDETSVRDEEEEQQQQLAQLEHSENQASTPKALDDLMSGVAGDLNRPQDAPSETGQTEVEAAAAAAARALDSVNIPTTNAAADDLQDVSPQSGTSGPSLEDGDGHVVDSPTAMDVDPRSDEPAYGQQPEAQMEDKTGSSLSYPGAMPAPGPSQRMMSMPLSTPQTPALELPPRSPNSTSNKKHKCPYCETEFTRHHNLKSHLLTHSQEKPFVCQSCQMRFRRLHDLKRHSKLHTGEKPHVCPNCDRKFARGDALARHSKGAGGCAGRRQTMGSFSLKDGYDGSNAGEADNSAVSGELYEGGADMPEEERRRLSMPSIRTQHVSGQAAPEGYAAGHSATYPPAGQRPGAAGGLYPPNADRGPSGSNTSPSVPNSHTPHTSISSMPLSAGSSSMYSHSHMTESPKPLSPAGQQRPANEQQHGNAAARGRGRGASGAVPQQGAEAIGWDPNTWAYFQHLEGTVKRLTSQMESEVRSKAQLLERLDAHDQQIAALTAEIASLRQQLVGSQEQSSPIDTDAAQQ